MTGWQKPKPQGAGPYGWWKDAPKPQWVRHDGGTMPSIGGGSALRRSYGDRRAEARARYIDRISNAWRDHRR